LFVFVVGHLVGNLQVFGSPQLINSYAHFLRSKPVLLWGARLGLLGCVGLHIAAALTLTALNRSARPIQYEGGTRYGSTISSRYMLVSGLVILAFLLYHLAHFTVLLPGINGVGDFSRLRTVLHGETVPDVYGMMILAFQVWWVVFFYLVAQGLLFMHLNHGVASMFQSLGWRNHVWWPRIAAFARVSTVAIFIGYSAIPLAILLHIVGADYAEKKKFEIQSTNLARTPGCVEGVVLPPETPKSFAWIVGSHGKNR
jgi:succinate dehydrogenase / fumarate reductase cytochrome b subunit